MFAHRLTPKASMRNAPESRLEPRGGVFAPTSGKLALLSLFRLKADLLISQFADRRKVFVTENRIKGATLESLKAQKDKELSRWNFEREKLGKEIKREVVGLVNSAFMKAYLDGFKTKGKAA